MEMYVVYMQFPDLLLVLYDSIISIKSKNQMEVLLEAKLSHLAHKGGVLQRSYYYPPLINN